MMKGLLLKDFYALRSYARGSFLLILFLILIPSMPTDNTFFLLFPCIFGALSVLSLIAYEEKEKWHIYALTLPYSRAQLVSVKYLTAILVGGATLLSILLIQSVWLLVFRKFTLRILLALIGMLIPFILLPTTVMLPFIFRYGAEKGRIAYACVMGVFTGGVTAVSRTVDLSAIARNSASPVYALLICLAACVLFVLSWQLSIRLYQKREL